MTMKRGGCGLRCGRRARLAAEESLPGIVSCRSGMAGVNARIIAESRREFWACVTAEGERCRRAKNVKYLPIYGLVLPFKKRQTEGLERRTKQNVTNGPVHPDLLYSKLTSLRVGTDLQDPRAILRW